jgi:hypothetical protein
MVREEVIYRRGVPADAANLAGFGSQSFVDAYGDREGGAEAWLQVWEAAAHAVGFYRKWCFREAGEVPFRLGTIVQRDLLMTRTLPAD